MEWNSGPFAAKTLPTGFPSLCSFYNQENLIVGEGQSHQAIYLLFKKKIYLQKENSRTLAPEKEEISQSIGLFQLS